MHGQSVSVSLGQSHSVSVSFSQLSGRLTTRLTEIGGKLDLGNNGWILAKSISVNWALISMTN